ncbi:MAG: hypothetical protein KAI66_06805, partial [Lentisphaeria bacterium]|nr:hypothetical protein [Lentisphaeria bacterium]
MSKRSSKHMASSRFQPASWLLVALVHMAWATCAAEPALRLLVPGNVFGGSKVMARIRVSNVRAEGGTLSWRLAYGERTLQRGEAAVATDDGGTFSHSFELRMPPVKDGVALRTELTVSVAGANPAQARTVIWIFAPSPWTSRKNEVEAWNLHLYDPEKTTADLLESQGVACHTIRHPSVLEGEKPVALLVGAGVDAGDYRGLVDGLVGLARSGGTIVWLEPAGGAVSLPPLEDLDALEFRGAQIVRELDKRLVFPSSAKPTSSLGLASTRSEVVCEVRKDAPGSCWTRLSFHSGGTLIVCTMPIVAQWETTPAARHFLDAILRLIHQRKSTL